MSPPNKPSEGTIKVSLRAVQLAACERILSDPGASKDARFVALALKYLLEMEWD